MPIGINDLDFDDEFEDYGGEEQEQEEQDKAWMEHPNVQYNQEEPEEPGTEGGSGNTTQNPNEGPMMPFSTYFG